MQPAEEWLLTYSATHQNPQNKRLHFVCVPLIFWSLFAALWMSPGPKGLVVGAAFILTSVFYLRLGFKYWAEMLVLWLASFLLTWILERLQVPVGWTALAVFILAWAGQFYGHKLEGKKPSFFQDLLYLLIGPLWIADHLFK